MTKKIETGRRPKAAALREADRVAALSPAQQKNHPSALAADPAKLSHINTYGALPEFYIDQPFVCRDCGTREIWLARDQKWYFEEAKGHIDARAVRCHDCRAQRKDAKRTRAFIRLFVGFALGCLAIGCTDEPISPWHSLPTATDATFRDVFFLDDERGWIVGGGHGVDGGILGQTLDGGETWTFRTGIVSNPRSRLFSLNAIHFWDERRGVIASTGGRLLRTVDGGQNWHAQIAGAGRGLSDLFILGDALGWAAGEQWVLRTTDGGESWQRANTGAGSNDDFRARAIHFFDADRGVLVGHHGAIRLTQDGGRSWEQADVSNDLGSTVLSAIDFVDDQTGWIVGEAGTLLASVDGGASWTLQHNPSRGDLNALEFVSPVSGWIAGYDRSTGISSILNTRDGGATWTREVSIEGESLRALLFLDADRGFAVGSRERRLPQRIFRYSAPSEP